MKLKVRATAVLIEEDSILLVEQRVSPSRNWSLPGGTLEADETIEECVVREMREETGLDVAIDRLLYVCDRMQSGSHVVAVILAVKKLGGQLRLGNEPEPWANPITGIRMVPIDSLMEYGFSETFYKLVKAGFPNSGTYQGLIENVGL
jgi:ADP-ribose pyrophosphatase YjhB (NUDIX family)